MILSRTMQAALWVSAHRLSDECGRFIHDALDINRWLSRVVLALNILCAVLVVLANDTSFWFGCLALTFTMGVCYILLGVNRFRFEDELARRRKDVDTLAQGLPSM